LYQSPILSVELLWAYIIKIATPCPNFSLQGKSQIVQDELAKLGEQMIESSEGTRAVALELCREFEDKFLAHITSGEVSDDLHY
jgi:dynamin 1/3